MKKTLLSFMLAAAPAAYAFDGLTYDGGPIETGAGIQPPHWILVCDNTGTCRAAGYQHDNTEHQTFLPVSLLLTRQAGADTKVEAQVRLLPAAGQEQKIGGITLQLTDWSQKNAKPVDYGPIQTDDEGIATLSDSQTAALLAHLRTPEPSIKFIADDGSDNAPYWTPYSNREHLAILAKMDEYQGRSGTPSALLNPGTSDKVVPPPAPAPEISAAAVKGDNSGDTITPENKKHAALLKLLQPYGQEKNCAFSSSAPDKRGQNITLYPLNDKQTLAETICQYGEEKGFYLFAILTADLKKVEKTVGGPISTGYNGYGEILGARQLDDKGCGINDLYLWNGTDFVLASKNSNGLCGKGFPGGAWNSLPNYTSNIREADEKAAH